MSSTVFAFAGGGVALDLPVGLFREGYQFDAILVDAGTPRGNLNLDAADTPEEILQKIVYNGARANIREVWVGGRSVHTLGP